MSQGSPDLAGYLPLHRSEALTDGIYAVAMTLLVIELKLPEHAALGSPDAYLAALAGLLPKGIAWVLSFFVLAIFWVAHHRVFAYLRYADAKLVTLNLVQLAFVSLMPFSSAIVGESAAAPLFGQVVYSINMAMLGVFGWIISRHIYLHPALASQPMPRPRYIGASIRIGGVVLVSVVAVVITAASRVPGLGNVAFMLMAVVNPVSRSFERRALAREAPASLAAT